MLVCVEAGHNTLEDMEEFGGLGLIEIIGAFWLEECHMNYM